MMKAVHFALIAAIALTVCLVDTPAVEAVEDEAVDQAVVAALRFLATQQRHDGCWNVEVMNESTAITSLAVMAFLAAGHVPGEGPYGQAIDRGINYVLHHQEANGMIVHKHGHGPMYDHGISTLMLSEVIGMTKKEQTERTRKVLENGVKLILKAQQVRKQKRDTGGWRYQPTTQESDLSVTGWQLLALRAAKDVGCDVPVQNIDLAVEYVKRCSSARGFGYQPGHGATSTLTAAGVLALQVCDHHGDPEVTSGIEYLRFQPLKYENPWFFYGAYYNAVCSYKYGGELWEHTKASLFAELLNKQKAIGSWEADAAGSEKQQGVTYSTSLAVLALTVEYGYLPIYQR